jgi:triosephosphate isomerase (TIM)
LSRSFLRPLIINLKNYPEISGEGSINLAKEAAFVHEACNVEIILAPPPPFLHAVICSTDLPIISQHVDDIQMGASTGFIVPEIVKSSGAIGSLINHSEHKINFQNIKNVVERLSSLDMVSIVCAADVEEVTKISSLRPDFIAIEPPELIGSGIAVSRANPSIIVDSVRVAHTGSPSTRVLCGAGIVDKDDVKKAFDLGASGILVASGVVKSSSWKKKIEELSSAFL